MQSNLTRTIDHQEIAKQSALNFLREHHVGVLATTSPGGKPHAAAVSYLVDDYFNLYLITRRGTRKFQNMVRKSRVAMVVGTDIASPVTAQIDGEAELLDEDQWQIVTDLSAAARRIGSYWWPIFRIPGGNFEIFRVKITRLRTLNLDAGKHPSLFRVGFQRVLP